MSSSISTPGELSSSAKRATGTTWRVVEAQHHVSTLKLTDTNAEQALLENLIESTKPVVPPECEHLDYLLATPFRYYPPYPTGSRFRRAGATPGVFYASDHVETAVAEAAFWRLLFYAESPIDLTRAPFDKKSRLWSDPINLGSCQDLADMARAEGIDVLKYMSVRDPQHRINVALLTCKAFSKRKPSGRQTWRIQLSQGGVRAICEMPKQTIEFDRSAFAADPRVSKMKWDRN
jgi:hypothetical protein